MTTAYWCVLAAMFLPYIWVGLAKSGGFDNSRPRESLAALTGWRQRAHWAQLNAYEAFPPFAAAVIIGHLTAVPQPTLDMLALAFVGLRLVHAACYIANLALLRSLIFGAAMACVVAIFVIAA